MVIRVSGVSPGSAYQLLDGQSPDLLVVAQDAGGRDGFQNGSGIVVYVAGRIISGELLRNLADHVYEHLA